MKKTIPLVLVFAFIFALAPQLSALAIVSEDKTANESPMMTTKAITTNTSSLEKIPSPEYIKYFREIRKVDGSLYGIKKPTEEAEKLKANIATSTNLEKISSPALINLYNQIKKIGNDLFGVKKSSSTVANITKNDDKTALDKKMTEMKKAGLEKITSLEHLSLFEKVTKVGNDLFGMRKKGAMILPKMTPELITCTSAAIDAKDASINISLTNSVTEITAAIDARGVCQKAAIALATGHQEAVKTCNNAFQATTKAAYEKAKTAQKTAWETYKSDLKNCSPEVSIDDGGDIIK